MKNEDEVLSEAKSNPAAGLFESNHCSSVDLRFRTARDKFDVTRFLEFFGETKEDISEASVTCRTLDPERLDYHVHFFWDLDTKKDDVNLFVSFHRMALQPQGGEREPFAEGFMAWLGSFFEAKSAPCDRHSEFLYSSGERQSRFLLPLKVNISEDIEAEIIGIAMDFPSNPDGVNTAKLSQGEKRLKLELFGSARVAFEGFDLRQEIEHLSSFASRLTKTKE